MRELYRVKVSRVVRYEGEIDVTAENPSEARVNAQDRATDTDFPWSEDSDEVTTGDITVPAEQPKKSKRGRR